MPTTSIAGREVWVDDEGFLTDLDQWDEELALALAAAVGIALTEDHHRAIRFARDDYRAQGTTPTSRRVATAGGLDTKRLYALFGARPASKMAYIAGLPKPADGS